MKGLLDFCETALKAFICAHSCNSWLTEKRPFHCGLPGLHKERKNLTEKGIRLELAYNTVVDINSRVLTSMCRSMASMCRSMNEGVKFHHYQSK